MGTCRLCGDDCELVDSHIIPKAFHRDLKGNASGAPVIIGTNPTDYPRKNPGGIYEEELLCRPCENRFGPCDDYGAQCLIQNYDRDVEPLSYNNGEVLAYRFPTWDEKRLRMFALSLLWRATVTTNEIFSGVTLGPHLARLTESILADEPGSPLECAPLRWLGRPSYSLYLWQQMFIVWRVARAPALSAIQTVPENFGFALLLATTSYYLIERPFIRIGKRFIGSRARRDAPP